MGPTPILFCSHVVDWGGAERVLADLLATIDRERFTPHLAVPGPGPLASHVEALGLAVHPVPIGGASPLRKALGLPGAARALRRLAQRLDARLLVATSMIAGYAAVLAQRPDLRCLWHLHIVTRSRLARLALRRAACVVTPSRAGAAAVDARLLASGRVRVIQNGVAARFFAAGGTSLRHQLGVSTGQLLVGIVGRIDPDKGHAVLLRAFAALPDRPAAPHLVVIGGEAFAEMRARVRGHTQHLMALASDLGMRDRVHFLGHLDDTADLLGQLDVVAVPSTALESAPRSIAEAQAAGRAVVASDLGGIPELIESGRTGMLVPPGDAAALTSALQQLLGDHEWRQRLGHSAQAHATATYSLAAFARRFEAACSETLASAIGVGPSTTGAAGLARRRD